MVSENGATTLPTLPFAIKLSVSTNDVATPPARYVKLSVSPSPFA